MQNNIPAVLAVLRHIYNTIMYAELNTKSDLCEVCGYDGEIQIVEENGKLVWKCPKCGCEDQNKMHVTRRTCGQNYIGHKLKRQKFKGRSPLKNYGVNYLEPSLFT